MTWEASAKLYLALFETVKHRERLALMEPARAQPIDQTAMPRARLDHFLRMCDDTGLLQHAVHSVPDRAHGYCIDDNARALLLTCDLEAERRGANPCGCCGTISLIHPTCLERRDWEISQFPELWADGSKNVGSEDSHGRTLSGPGRLRAKRMADLSESWARISFPKSVPVRREFRSPRCLGILLCLASIYYAAANALHPLGRDSRGRVLVERVDVLLSSDGDAGGIGSRMCLRTTMRAFPKHFIVTGRTTGDPLTARRRGFSPLQMAGQPFKHSPAGCFRPIGVGQFQSASARFPSSLIGSR